MPATCRQLIDLGYTVVVASGAGTLSSFADISNAAAGDHIFTFEPGRPGPSLARRMAGRRRSPWVSGQRDGVY
jgi:hypothetical protein